MGDLLKEAIADAKAVRETALANAKMALEEAFTPQLKSMLSAKLKEDEFEDEEEFGGEEEIPAEEPVVAPEEGDYGAEEHDEFGAEEPEVDESKIIEIDGVKYAPVVSEQGDEEGGEEEIDIEDDNLDLEAIVRELESEINEEDDAYDEADPGEKPEHVGGSMDGVPALKTEANGNFDNDDDDDDDDDD